MERPVSAPCLGDPAFVPADRVRPRVIPRDDPNSKVLGGVWVLDIVGIPRRAPQIPRKRTHAHDPFPPAWTDGELNRIVRTWAYGGNHLMGSGALDNMQFRRDRNPVITDAAVARVADVVPVRIYVK